MFIGWPHGWHGPQNAINRNSPASDPYFLGVATPDPVPHYLTPTNSVGIYKALSPAGVIFLGLEDPTTDDHASLSYESCRWLWGNSGNPLGMTADGQIIFLNTVKRGACLPMRAGPDSAARCLLQG